MIDKLRVGMIGVGGFGSVRRRLMRESGLFELAACCDRNAQALQRVCRQEQAQPCASYQQLLATPGLEAVVISTGADSHAPLTLAALEAGLHVFVEKPLCCSVEEIIQLRQTAQRTGRVVAVGHNDNATNPVNLLARQCIREGRLGTVACYEKNSSHSGGLEIQPGAWRGLADRNPGGMLFQCGVHALHRLIDLFGPIASVQAMMRYDANPNTQTADVANVLIRHHGGMVGTLNCYHVTAYVHELRLFGTRGNLYFDTHARQAWFQQRRRNEPETREPLPLPPAPANAAWSSLANWHRAIRHGGRARPSLEDGIQAVLPVFAAELAAREQRQIDLAQLLPSPATAAVP